ncbi:hypothetical protein AAC387_Pa12g2395 [Persea americana]
MTAHPKAALYKNKTFPDWVSLAIIFGDSVADGDGLRSKGHYQKSRSNIQNQRSQSHPSNLWSAEGMDSEVRAIIRNPGAISRIKEANLTLLTYGQLK